MKYRKLLFVLIILGINVFFSSRVGAEETKYKIAVLVPQNGPVAAYGQLQMEGYGLAETEIADAKIPVQVRYFDIEALDRIPADIVTNDVLPWQPDIIVGPYSSETAKQIVKILRPSGPPLIIPSPTMDELTREPSSYIFRLSLPARISAHAIAEFLTEQKNEWKTESIGILSEDSGFARAAANSLKEELEKQSLPATDAVFYNNANFNQTLEQYLKNPPDVVIAISRDAQQALEISKELQGKSKIMGFLSGFSTPIFRASALKQSQDLFVYSPWYIDSQDPDTARFISRFKNKYRTALSGSDPQYHNAQAYSALMIAAQALGLHKESGKPLDAVLRETVFVTPMGRISFVNFNGFYQQSMTRMVIQRYQEGSVSNVYPAATVEKMEPKPAGSAKKSFFQTLLGNQFIALFAIIGLGLLLGSIKYSGVSLGSSGVLFVALIFGHFHFTIPGGTGSLGLILFIYCVGLTAGPSFFSAFAEQGINFAKLAIVIVVLGATITVLAAKIFSLPVDLAVGLFAGALTSTPALAAAMDNLKDLGSLVSVGYGIAYPYGVIGVVLFVQLLPKLIGKDLDQEAEKFSRKANQGELIIDFVEVQNTALFGKKIDESDFITSSNVRVSRVMEDGHLVPLKYDTVFKQGQILKLVGEEKNIDRLIQSLGKKIKLSDRVAYQSSKDIANVFVTSKEVYGKTVRELETLKRFGVTITRITKNEVTFVPNNDTKIEFFDQLRVVGDPEGLKQFTHFVGHREKALQQTDLLSLAVGMFFGVVVGLMPISIAQSPSFSLGLSGGLLLVSLMLGHFGRIGPIVGRVPVASRLLMMEIGLVFFLAGAGIEAGGAFLTIIQKYGIKLFLVGAFVTTMPMILGYFIGIHVLKINLLQVLGGICGGMTSTPALGALKSKTDSEIPVISYAAAYPVALIFMLITANLIIAFLK